MWSPGRCTAVRLPLGGHMDHSYTYLVAITTQPAPAWLLNDGVERQTAD